MRLTSIILAAGSSTRMGTDKALIKINDKSAINIILDKLLVISQKIIIVRGYRNQPIQPGTSSKRIILLYNPIPERGMFSSLKSAFRHDVSGTHFLIHLIDQPFIKPSTYRKLVYSIDDRHLLFVPVIEDEHRSGHPIIIARPIVKMIRAASPFSTLKHILNSLPSETIARIPVTDRSILDNINTRQQLNTKLIKKGN